MDAGSPLLGSYLGRSQHDHRKDHGVQDDHDGEEQEHPRRDEHYVPGPIDEIVQLQGNQDYL